MVSWCKSWCFELVLEQCWFDFSVGKEFWASVRDWFQPSIVRNLCNYCEETLQWLGVVSLTTHRLDTDRMIATLFWDGGVMSAVRALHWTLKCFRCSFPCFKRRCNLTKKLADVQYVTPLTCNITKSDKIWLGQPKHGFQHSVLVLYRRATRAELFCFSVLITRSSFRTDGVCFCPKGGDSWLWTLIRNIAIFKCKFHRHT